MRLFLLVLLAALTAGCSTSRRGGSSDDDDSADGDVNDDDDATADDDDATADDDDATADDDDDDDDDSTPAPDPVDENDDLLGRVFVVELSSGDFVEPPGIGAIIASQLGDGHFLAAVHEDSDFGGGEIDLIWGSSPFPGVDPCAEAVLITEDEPADWNDPSFSFGPGAYLDLSLDGTDVRVDQAELSGYFRTDGEQVQGGVFAGNIDTRPLVPLIDEEGDPDAICDLVQETVGVDCVECGGEFPGPYCLTMRVEDIIWNWLPGEEMPVRSCEDILSDFACEDSWDNWDEDGDGFPELCQ